MSRRKKSQSTCLGELVNAHHLVAEFVKVAIISFMLTNEGLCLNYLYNGENPCLPDRVFPPGKGHFLILVRLANHQWDLLRPRLANYVKKGVLALNLLICVN